jgi:ribosomal protein L24
MGTARHAIRPMFARSKWRLLRGDTVQIMAGRDKGQTGVVARVIRDDKKPAVIVEGRNLVRARGRDSHS